MINSLLEKEHGCPPQKKGKLTRISIVIPTRNRPKDLHELLLSLLDQDTLQFEVIIVDDSSSQSSKQIVDSLVPKFKAIGCEVKCIKGSGDGLTSARNLGVRLSKGEAILFLDDDTLLDRNVVSITKEFLENHSEALGTQGNMINPQNSDQRSLSATIWNTLNKAFMLTSYEPNNLRVRRSGISTFPRPLTKVITVQRLSGCCCCYRRSIFDKFRLDENLKRWSNMEDTDFSYRVYKNYQSSLYALHRAKIFHKGSLQSRLPKKTQVYMSTIYWSYVFFKDIYDGSVLNLTAFLWALVGNLVTNVGSLIVKRKSRSEWFALIYFLGSYATALRHLKNIRMARLDFFNKNL